ncbi:MAG TPA: hypothetical protein VMW41_02660 [Candidatus Bathyarchaeia archaeon]|nr:hypothetical protein [Candidatus Bathyarchaeia archaeon]
MNGETVIIRDRYQITIPYSLRKMLTWLVPKKVVRVKIINKEKVLIEPYREIKVDWQEIFRQLTIIRDWGAKTSLSQFIAKDREFH